jgi:hypothetical protein
MKTLMFIMVLPGIIFLDGCWAPPIGTIDVPHLPGWLWGPFGFIGGLALLAIYLLPTIIAAARKKGNLPLIILVNILLGWTLVGWIVALVLALL